MPTLKLPKVGKVATEATVLRWRRNTRDRVAKGDVLVALESDEGLVEIEAPQDGELQQILAAAGQTVSVGGALAVVGPVGSGAVAPGPADNAASSPARSDAGSTASIASSRTSTPAKADPQPKVSAVSKPNQPVGKVIPILMPKAGQSMEEGVLVKWHVQPGAVVEKGKVLFEIETDKATMEVEATDSGRLARVVVADGGVSPVLLPVAYLAESDADVDAFIAAQGGAETPQAATSSAAPAPEAAASEPAAAAAATSDTGRVKASPAARKLAAERGVDLTTVVRGSGPGGRVLSTDVPASTAAKPAAAAAPVAQGELPAGVVRKRMSGMRKAIARNLTLSKTTIPHWYITTRVDAGPLMAFYRSQKAKIACSLNDVIVMACAKAIMEFPAMHSRVDGETVLEFAGANIGIAVGLDDGLVVPVVLNAEKLTLEQLGAETKRLANQARAGKVENMGQGIFTISNLGMYGVDEFVAIVNPPEAAILAVGAVREDVIVKGGAIRAGQVVNLTLSSDHRLIDGTLGAQFMGRLKALIEEPLQLIA